MTWELIPLTHPMLVRKKKSSRIFLLENHPLMKTSKTLFKTLIQTKFKLPKHFKQPMNRKRREDTKIFKLKSKRQS